MNLQAARELANDGGCDFAVELNNRQVGRSQW